MIEGLYYKEEFISGAEEKALIEKIDAQSWLSDLKRKTQHYGYRYDYTKRTVDSSSYLGSLPDFCYELLAKVGIFFGSPPNQLIINDYQPGQGISPHVDCISCFGPVIASISLLSPCVMEFSYGNENKTIWLQKQSLLVLHGNAREFWKHSISARLQDVVDEKTIPRQRRVSLTFRTVNI